MDTTRIRSKIAQHRFGNMAAEVLNSSSVLRLNFCASISATNAKPKNVVRYAKPTELYDKLTMKILKNFITVFLSFVSSYCFAQNTDTLRVSQSDKNIFEKQILPVRLHYSPIPFANLRQPFQTHYELINPQNGAYYFIYNDKKQLIKEGIYSIRQYASQDKTEEHGAFYNSKTYYYKKNGKLISIDYQQDGGSHKTEYFDNKKRFKKIWYFNKKTSDTEKIEIYKKGQLKETRIYTSFDNYYKEKVK